MIFKNAVFIIFLLGISNNLSSQNMWHVLGKVTYRKEYDALLGLKVDRPIFSKEVKALAGKEIRIKGYIIPTDGYKSHTEFVFSAFPYSMCFFCGQAGPETVMEVSAKSPIKYTSEPVEIRGKLQINEKDINRLMYQLVEVEKI